MSVNGISLVLTTEQVELVIADVAARAGQGEPLSLVMPPGELAVSALLEDRTVSRSLLYGLMAYSCLPLDGGERELKEIAKVLDVSPRVAGRYVHTLALVGLVEQSPGSRKFCRVSGSARGSQS